MPEEWLYIIKNIVPINCSFSEVGIAYNNFILRTSST